MNSDPEAESKPLRGPGINSSDDFQWLRQESVPRSSKVLRSCIVVLLVVILILTHAFTYKLALDQRPVVSTTIDKGRLPTLPDLPVSYGFYEGKSVYGGDDDQNATDAVWNAFDDSHGMIAVEEAWAMRNGWAEAKRHPFERNKMVYLVEAYHQIHCLKMIRQALRASLEGKNDVESVHHSWHCFDALKQVSSTDKKLQI
ncbi:MAG: hypothetical protein Q9162_003786 [Coniocarpon cinnabarinum]